MLGKQVAWGSRLVCFLAGCKCAMAPEPCFPGLQDKINFQRVENIVGEKIECQPTVWCRGRHGLVPMLLTLGVGFHVQPQVRS